MNNFYKGMKTEINKRNKEQQRRNRLSNRQAGCRQEGRGPWASAPQHCGPGAGACSLQCGGKAAARQLSTSLTFTDYTAFIFSHRLFHVTAWIRRAASSPCSNRKTRTPRTTHQSRLLASSAWVTEWAPLLCAKHWGAWTLVPFLNNHISK